MSMFKSMRYALMLAAALVLLGACSENEENNAIIPQPEQHQVPAPRITADMGNGATTTRAVVEENSEYATKGEDFRWVVGSRVMMEFKAENGLTYSTPYKVATVNEEHPNRCTFVPKDEDYTLPAGTYTVTGFSSYGAWQEITMIGSLPTPTQTGNKNSDHLHDTQLMISEETTVVITKDMGDFNLSFKHQSSVMRFVVIDNIGLEEGTTVTDITLSSDKKLFDTKLMYFNNTLTSSITASSLTLNVTNGTFNADDNNSFHGFMAMSGYKKDANPEKLQVDIALSNGSIFTKTVEGSDKVGLPDGFKAGASYSFTMKLSNLTETSASVLVTTAVGQIAANSNLIDKHLSPFGTLIVRGPVSDADIAAIGTRMKDADKQAIKNLDLSGTTEVTTIGQESFYRCTSLNSILLPPSITEISGSAFEYCTALKEIVIPENVKVIGHNAFYGCSNLATVNLPTSMANGTLGTYAFALTALRSITIPSGIKTIPQGCFEYCTQLESVTLPTGLEEIQLGAFAFCGELNTISVPASVKVVGSHAFSISNISILFEGTLPAKDGGSSDTTTAVEGYLVINKSMNPLNYNLLLPNIKSASLAATYKINSNATVWYNYTGTGDRTNTANYTKCDYVPQENEGGDFEGGGGWGVD